MALTEIQLRNLISFNIPDNIQGLVTPFKIREVMNEMVTKAFDSQLDSLVADNPLSFNATTKTLSMPRATAGQSGYLHAFDFAVFNTVAGDYVSQQGEYRNPSWLAELSWDKIINTPATLAGYGITDPIVLTSGNYTDPSWIASLAYSKLTGAPVLGTVSAINLNSNVSQYLAGNGTWKTIAWTEVSGKPTIGTVAAINLNSSGNTYLAGDGTWKGVSFSTILDKPSTLAGYGIGDAFPLSGGTLSGTAGNGFVGYSAQSAIPTTPPSGFRLFANNSNALSWIGANGFVRTFDGTANTADRVYTLPNTSGTFGLLGANQTWSGSNTFSAILNATGGIGTSGATNVDFFANNALVGRIFQSTGRWSIGYSTPIDGGFRLDVNGSIRASSISTSSELYTTSGVRLSNSNVGSALSSGQAIVASASTGWFDLYNSTGNGFGYRIFNGNTGQVFEITRTLWGYGSNLIYQNGGTFTDIEAAIVQVNSTAKGVLLPRMTSARRNSIGIGVTSIAVTNGGSGYTSAPVVNIISGGGYGATATAVVSDGVVTAVNITRAGNGYTSAPNIALVGGGGSGATATATIGGTPPTGLIVYDITLNHLCFHNGTAWQRISHSPA